MRTKRSREGYLLIDNRFGPGVSKEFIEKSGKDVPFAGEGAMYESATVTCSHCHRIVVLNPNRSRPRNYCAKCDSYICDGISCVLDCKPLNAVIEKLQNEGGMIIEKEKTNGKEIV